MSKNNRVPVFRGSGGASWRRQNTSSSPTQLDFPKSAALPNAASVFVPASPCLLPGSAPTGRTHSHPRKSGWWKWEIYTSNSVIGRFFWWLLKRPRSDKETVTPGDSWNPGIHRQECYTDKTAAGTRIAPQADEADGYLAKFLFNTNIFWTSA